MNTTPSTKTLEKHLESSQNISPQNPHHIDNSSLSNTTTHILQVQQAQSIINMRKKWSNALLITIVIILLFDMYIIIGLGHGWLSFQNAFMPPAFIAESLVKVAGLSYMVVQFLFNENTTF